MKSSVNDGNSITKNVENGRPKVEGLSKGGS